MRWNQINGVVGGCRLRNLLSASLAKSDLLSLFEHTMNGTGLVRFIKPFRLIELSKNVTPKGIDSFHYTLEKPYLLGWLAREGHHSSERDTVSTILPIL